MQTSSLCKCDLMEKFFGLKTFTVKYGNTTVNCYLCRAGVKAGTSFISSASLGCGGSIAPSPETWCDKHMDCTSYVAVFLWFSASSLCCSLPCQLPCSSVQLQVMLLCSSLWSWYGRKSKIDRFTASSPNFLRKRSWFAWLCGSAGYFFLSFLTPLQIFHGCFWQLPFFFFFFSAFIWNREKLLFFFKWTRCTTCYTVSL